MFNPQLFRLRMMKRNRLTVTEPTGEGAGEPAADRTVTLNDFSFAMTGTLAVPAPEFVEQQMTGGKNFLAILSIKNGRRKSIACC